MFTLQQTQIKKSKEASNKSDSPVPPDKQKPWQIGNSNPVQEESLDWFEVLTPGFKPLAGSWIREDG